MNGDEASSGADMSKGGIVAGGKPGGSVPLALAETLLGAAMGAIAAVARMAAWTSGVNATEARR
jgi:hypothetical protein